MAKAIIQNDLSTLEPTSKQEKVRLKVAILFDGRWKIDLPYLIWFFKIVRLVDVEVVTMDLHNGNGGYHVSLL
jgi:hypothetical protein